MEQKILVVIDMQNDFITGSLGTEQAESIVDKVIDKINFYKDRNWPIFITQDTHNGNYLETSEGQTLPIEHCIKDTEGWQLQSDIAEALDGYLYTTVLKGSFGSLDLKQRIRNYILMWDNNNINFEIEIVGLCTDICVIANAITLKAIEGEYGFNDPVNQLTITVDPECCAGTTPEMHEKALDIMKQCHINIIEEEVDL